mgnify:CR=1 FL=1
MLISNAYAQTAGAAGSMGGLMEFLPIILMFGVLYFLMIRPQMKRAKEHKGMLDKLAKHNIVHKNKAGNLKSSLQMHVNAL